MKNFTTFLTEEKQDYRVVVLGERRIVKKLKKANRPTIEKPISTSSKLYRRSKDLGLDVYSCRINGAFVTRDDDSIIRIHNEDDDEGFVIDNDTIVFIRGNVTAKDSYLDLISQLERYGVSCVNSRECIEVCADKYRTYLRLNEVGLLQPDTVLIPNDEEESVDRAVDQLDKPFPLVLKTLQGSKGVGVLLVETERSLQSTVSLVYKIDPFADILLQEYIESDHDVRVVIVNREIIGAMRRERITDDFRSNVSQGAEILKYELSKLEKDMCLQAAKAVNGQWVGVDFIPSDNPKTEPPHILEVNHSPGTEGISKVIDQNIVELVLDNFYDRTNWRTSPKECGVLETIEAMGIEMTAKMDTGNNVSACSLHADEFEINGKIVKWSLNGKSYRHPLKRMVKLVKPVEERPVIEIDVKFLNMIYKVEVSLDTRNSIPFLANRDLMKRANLMINPARKFMLTNISNDRISITKDEE